MKAKRWFSSVKDAYRCSDYGRARRRLRAWSRLSLGRRLQEMERRELEHVLPNLFGYHILQMGVPGEANLLESSRISHRIVQDNLYRHSTDQARRALFADAAATPINSDSVDVVLLPHLLEFEPEPHQVLREVERILIPEGHVVILGFNPWSWWGVRRLLTGWRKEAPWCGRFYSLTRIKDWLALLGFDTVLTRCYFFRPPLHSDTIMARLGFLERLGARWWPLLGGSYLLVARKRVTTLTPIRPRWRARKRLVPGGVAEPTLRNTSVRNDPNM